jgi:hypothetical protein
LVRDVAADVILRKVPTKSNEIAREAEGTLADIPWRFLAHVS